MNKLKKEALKIIAGFLPENEIKVMDIHHWIVWASVDTYVSVTHCCVCPMASAAWHVLL